VVGVQGSGFRVQGSGLRVQGAGFRVQGSGFRVQGSGFRGATVSLDPNAACAPPRENLAVSPSTWKREFKLPWREAGPPNHHVIKWIRTSRLSIIIIKTLWEWRGMVDLDGLDGQVPRVQLERLRLLEHLIIVVMILVDRPCAMVI